MHTSRSGCVSRSSACLWSRQVPSMVPSRAPLLPCMGFRETSFSFLKCSNNTSAHLRFAYPTAMSEYQPFPSGSVREMEDWQLWSFTAKAATQPPCREAWSPNIFCTHLRMPDQTLLRSFSYISVHQRACREEFQVPWRCSSLTSLPSPLL